MSLIRILRSRRWCALASTLLAFWLLLAGRIDLQTVGVGVVVALSVSRLCVVGWPGKMELPEFKRATLLLLARYATKFVIELVAANIEVAKLVLHPALPINPQIIRFKTRLKKPITKVLLANSITLTPGTLTIDVQGDEFIVHALTDESAHSVANWVIEDIFCDMEAS